MANINGSRQDFANHIYIEICKRFEQLNYSYFVVLIKFMDQKAKLPNFVVGFRNK